MLGSGHLFYMGSDPVMAQAPSTYWVILLAHEAWLKI